MGQLILYLLLFILIIALPIALSIWGYKRLAKNGYKKIAIAIPAIIVGTLSYSIYTAVSPVDNFYKEDFESNTGLKFPVSGNILSKAATYPDQHGKYSSVAVVSISASDYKLLFEQTNVDTTFKAGNLTKPLNIYNEVTSGISDSDILTIVRKKKLAIAFLKDKKRIVLERRIYDF